MVVLFLLCGVRLWYFSFLGSFGMCSFGMWSFVLGTNFFVVDLCVDLCCLVVHRPHAVAARGAPFEDGQVGAFERGVVGDAVVDRANVVSFCVSNDGVRVASGIGGKGVVFSVENTPRYVGQQPYDAGSIETVEGQNQKQNCGTPRSNGVEQVCC